MRRSPARTALLAVIGVGIAFISLFPVLFMARVAFLPPSEYRTMPIDWAAPLYTDSLSFVLSGDFPRHLFNSLLIASATTLVVIALAALAGHALAHIRTRRKDNFLFFVLTTRMGPAVVFALPIFLLMTNLQLIDSYVGIVLVYVFYNLAFAIWMLHGFFLDIPVEVEEAGLVEGMTTFGVFWRVSLPMALPGLIATTTLVFILTWNEFFYAFVLTRDVAKTFPTDIPGFFGSFRVEWGQMFAASLLGVIPPVAFGVMIRKWLARGLSAGTIE